jgi:hypothetical protein
LAVKDWSDVEVRDTEKGPLIVAIVTRRVGTMLEERIGDEELLVVVRCTEEDGTLHCDYHVFNARADSPFQRVAE